MAAPLSSQPPIDLPRTRAAIEQGIAAGWHSGAQLALSRQGSRFDLVIGESRPGVPMTPDTLVLWLSSTKPLVAAAVLQLCEQGKLALDSRVADYLPAFAEGGKASITLRHLLTHTGGFRFVELGWPQADWAEIIDRLCRARLERNWVPGETAGYHPLTSWYVLGELVRLTSGTPCAENVRTQICEPLGMIDSWVGMPADRYAAYGDRIALLPETDKPGQPVHRFSTPQGATDCIPGAGGRGPMRELVRFYESLLRAGDPAAPKILRQETVAAMTARQREGKFDETFKHRMDWGWGLIIDSNRYGAETVPYGYGPYASDRTFGHGGSQSSVGFADPAHGLAVGCYFNGCPGEPQHQQRIRAVLAELYRDLGLAGE